MKGREGEKIRERDREGEGGGLSYSIVFGCGRDEREGKRGRERQRVGKGEEVEEVLYCVLCPVVHRGVVTFYHIFLRDVNGFSKQNLKYYQTL